MIGDWEVYGVVGYSGVDKLVEIINLKYIVYGLICICYILIGGEIIVSDNFDIFDMYNFFEVYIFDYYEVNFEDIFDDKYVV